MFHPNLRLESDHPQDASGNNQPAHLLHPCRADFRPEGAKRHSSLGYICARIDPRIDYLKRVRITDYPST